MSEPLDAIEPGGDVEPPPCLPGRTGTHCWHLSPNQSSVGSVHECQLCCHCGQGRHVTWRVVQSPEHGAYASVPKRLLPPIIRYDRMKREEVVR